MKLSDLTSADMLPGSKLIAASHLPMHEPHQWTKLIADHPKLGAPPESGNMSLFNPILGKLELQRVNAWFNDRMLFRPDRSDDWSPPVKTYEKYTLFNAQSMIGYADCDSYVTAKKGYLQFNAIDWRGPLCFALCRIIRWGRDNGAHAILLALAPNQTYVLDNRHNTLLQLDQAVVKWGSGLKMMAYHNARTGRWGPLVRVKRYV